MNITFPNPLSPAAPPAARQDNLIEFDIHGLLGIRLINASPADVDEVSAHLGLSPTGIADKPGITIQFIDAGLMSVSLCRLGCDEAGFNDSEFFLLRTEKLARARARLDFDTLGTNFHMLCESGLPAIPLLRSLINIAMLARGIVPVHAAAFNYAGKGVLVAGWSHGSKTGTLLSHMALGARFVGDEWIYLDTARNRMVGLPDHLEARRWYLRELPMYRSLARRKERMRAFLAHRIVAWLAPWARASERRKSQTAKLVRCTHQALAAQQSINLKPFTLFGRERCPLESRLDILIMGISRDQPDPQLSPAPLTETVARLAASFVFEQRNLLSCYQKFLFAFPDRRNNLLDRLEEVYLELATRAIEGKKAYVLFHPYPVSVVVLRSALQRLFPSS